MQIKLTKDQAATLDRVRAEYGFLSADDVRVLVEVPEFSGLQCLIRCGCVRPVVRLDDVSDLVKIITNEGSDYVRDVSFTVAALEVLSRILD